MNFSNVIFSYIVETINHMVGKRDNKKQINLKYVICVYR